MCKRLINSPCLVYLLVFMSVGIAGAAEVTPHVYIDFVGTLNGTSYVPASGELDTTGTFAAHHGTEIVSGDLGILSDADGAGQESFEIDASSFNANGTEFTGTAFIAEAIFTRTGEYDSMAPIIDIGGQCFIRFHSGLSAGNWDGSTDVSNNNIQANPEVGETHHYAIVYDGADTIDYYLDGAAIFQSGNGSPQGITTLISWGNIRHPSVDGGRQIRGEYDAVAFSTFTGGFDPDIDFILPGGLGPRPFAMAMAPKNGSMIGATETTLEWRAGEFAVSHDIYLGESYDEVDQAAPDDALFQGSQTATTFSVTNLTPGQTYYWRIDEINDAEPNSPWKGEVWSFRVQPDVAWGPTPGDGANYVPPDQALTWNAGMNTLFHTVFLGESFDEVTDAVAGGFMTASPSYDPGDLELDKTYYWRVDEFTMTGTVKGEVWSFRTMPDIPVSDPSLALWYRLDEAEGSMALDWSGHGNHGAIAGEALWTQDGYDWAAFQFGGRNYVTVANNDQMKLTGSGSYSVALHIKLENTNQQVILYHGLGCSTWASWFLGVAGGEPGIATVPGNFVFGVREANGEDYVGVSAPAQAHAWVHVAAIYDGTLLRLYLDGQEVSSASVPLPWDSDEDLYIGADPGCSGRVYSTAVIDDLRIYDRPLTADEVAEVMRIDLQRAWAPQPSHDSITDVRDAAALSWKAGDTAASHDIYFGTDRDAVAAADEDAPEFQGNQPGTSFPLTGLVEMGGGDYFWRIDEVEADGTVQTGNLWRFAIPDYLIVDDFESYTNEVGSRVFEEWVDGVGFTQPVETPGNETGAMVGHDIWSGQYPTLMEIDNVHGGAQAMPIYYDNTVTPFRSEADRTFTPAQNWT
ncbi:MAG: hypothetical protein JW741_08995, partial [Sedimentisphaerales bacterium]|nr:hypothetical protein [Sedimentisphaerales bacterium]